MGYTTFATWHPSHQVFGLGCSDGTCHATYPAMKATSEACDDCHANEVALHAPRTTSCVACHATTTTTTTTQPPVTTTTATTTTKPGDHDHDQEAAVHDHDARQCTARGLRIQRRRRLRGLSQEEPSWRPRLRILPRSWRQRRCSQSPRPHEQREHLQGLPRCAGHVHDGLPDATRSRLPTSRDAQRSEALWPL